MKAIFYKLVDPSDPEQWWQKEIEIKCWDDYFKYKDMIHWTNKTQRYCYLYPYQSKDDLELYIKVKEDLEEDGLACMHAVIKKYFLVIKYNNEKFGTDIEINTLPIGYGDKNS